MQKRRLLNLSPARQSELSHRYPWLSKVHGGDRDVNVQVVSVSVFDHWLSREEACELLENVSHFEQARRDALHAEFCANLIDRTEVISFTFRGIRKNRPVFREFTSKAALAAYCTPHGGRTLRHREFHVVLPELNSVFYESWDDTNHLFFQGGQISPVVLELAKQSGLHVLSHG